jgi:hypothetical protein
MVGSAAGHDGIPAGILRVVWGSLNGRLFLSLIISASLSLGHVPTDWKRAIIHSIPKAQSSEFRPISLLNQVGKVCERIVTWFLQSEASIRPNQLGCRAGVFFIDTAQLAHHYSAVSTANKRPCAGIFLDITKAYDRVHTGILFQKLSADPLISLWILR